MLATSSRYVAITVAVVVFFNFGVAERFGTWTFDRRNGTTIIPEPPSSKDFYADASSLGTNTSVIFPPGKNGDCLFVDGKELVLAKNLNHSCILDLDECKSGLTISFDLKVVSWNNASAPIILKTTPESNNSAGFSLSKSDDNKLLFNLVGSSGKKSSVKFSITFNSWVKYRFVVFQQSTHHKFGDNNPTTTSEAFHNKPQKFVVGSENGATFYLDELSVNYAQNSDSTLTTLYPASVTTSGNDSSGLNTHSSTMPTKDGNSSTPQATTSSNESTSDLFNIWIPIVLGILVCGVAFCVILIICRRRQRKDAEFNDPKDIVMEFAATRSGSYLRTSTVERYHELNSIPETDDDNTENEAP